MFNVGAQHGEKLDEVSAVAGDRTLWNERPNSMDITANRGRPVR
ncbi:hypothetical protein VIBNISFn118_630046 [Vibrio nigripulchritudo SFn118]|nr:hypothetical protein VIBNISFn118_630046 [Vibrio nigripulchritudo SFn118]